MRNLSLGLGLRGGKSEVDRILQSIRSDPAVQIAGRDGSMSLADPGCTFLDPTTGATIAANRAYNLVGPDGLVLPMYTAFPAIVNLCPAVTLDVDLTSNTLSGLSRTLVEGTENSQHYSGSAAFALSDGTAYRFRAIVRRSSGSRHAIVRAQNIAGGTYVGVAINLSTGTLTDEKSAGATISNKSSTAVTGGWLVVFDISMAAWGGNPSVYLLITNLDTGTSVYTGDGTSGVTFEAVTLVASTITPLGIAEGATRAADDAVWTTTIPAVCDIAQLIARPYKAAYANDETFLYGGTTGQPSLSAAATPSFTATGLNTAAASKSASGTAGIVAVVQRTELIVTRFTATGISISINGGAFSAETAIANAPWVHDGTVRLNYSDGTRAPYALVSAMLRDGGFSTAQLNAMNLAFANGRTIPVLA